MRSVELQQQPYAAWLGQLESIAALPEDWDSYGASRVSSTAVATARALFNALSLRHPVAERLQPFHIAPIATGGVQLEWKRADGSAMELWIDSEGQIDAVLDRPAAEPRIVEKRLAGIGVAIEEIEAFVA